MIEYLPDFSNPGQVMGFATCIVSTLAMVGFAFPYLMPLMMIPESHANAVSRAIAGPTLITLVAATAAWSAGAVAVIVTGEGIVLGAAAVAILYGIGARIQWRKLRRAAAD